MVKRLGFILALMLILASAVFPMLANAAEQPDRLISVGSTSATVVSAADIGPEVWVGAYDQVVKPGDTTTVGVKVRNISHLYGASFDLMYDSAVLTPQPLAGEETKVVSPGSGFDWSMNTWDPDLKMITLANLQVGVQDGLNLTDGDWHELGTISFTVNQGTAGQSILFEVIDSLANLAVGKVCVKLSDPNAQAISYTATSVATVISDGAPVQFNFVPYFPISGLATPYPIDLSEVTYSGTLSGVLKDAAGNELSGKLELSQQPNGYTIYLSTELTAGSSYRIELLDDGVPRVLVLW
jgi:hypothetical protein